MIYIDKKLGTRMEIKFYEIFSFEKNQVLDNFLSNLNFILGLKFKIILINSYFSGFFFDIKKY